LKTYNLQKITALLTIEEFSFEKCVMSIEEDIPTVPTLPTLETHHSKLTLPKTSFDNVVLTYCNYSIIVFSFRYYIG
jgi:hypothetical protein